MDILLAAVPRGKLDQRVRADGLPANYPSLQRDVSCEAVVIGGGISGALAAIHWLKPA